MKWCIFFLMVASTTVGAQDTWKDVYSESAWKDRDRWQKADELIRSLGLITGSQVADVGCHEGYMTVKLSGMVGSSGRVYAVDIEQQKLDRLKVILETRAIKNVIPTKGEYDNPMLPMNALDAVLILDTYHEMDQRDQMLRHIREALKAGGRLVICEAIADSRRESPREDQERRHELGMKYAVEDLEKAGFTIVRRQDPLVDRTKEKGDKMWIIVAKK
jgi:ubiquinone/menaquinone biosynthesis C-methylase UbiE